jgi:hypothetical protein
MYNIFWRHERILPGRPCRQFYILLWHFTANISRCEKTSIRILSTENLAVASRQRAISHFPLHQGRVEKTIWLSSLA